MLDIEALSILQVAADRVAAEIGGDATVIVIVHRPGKTWMADTSAPKGQDTTLVAHTVEAVSNYMRQGRITTRRGS